MATQPQFHPRSTPGQILAARIYCGVYSAILSLFPQHSSGTNRTAETALGEYQAECVDPEALRLEIAEKNPESTIYRLIRAVRSERAALQRWEEFYSAGWYGKNLKLFAGTVIVLMAWLMVLESKDCITLKVSAAIDAFWRFF